MKIKELLKSRNLRRRLDGTKELDSRVYHSGEKDGTPFQSSLASMTPQDIPTRVKPERKKLFASVLAGSLRYMFLILSVLVFVGSSIALAYYLTENSKQTGESEHQSQIFHGEASSDLVTIDAKLRVNAANPSMSEILSGDYSNVIYEGGQYNEEFERARAKLYELKRQNADIWGWITVPNTNIDYPILLADDNDFYLYRSFAGTYSRNGSIFADFRTQDAMMNNKNLVVYGHNVVGTSTMFNKIIEFSREDVFRNRRITITTFDGIYTFEVFSVYSTSPKHNYIKTAFASDDDFLSFINTCRQMSLYDKDIPISAQDKILTLSTCTVRGDGQRWAVHAKLISVSN